MKVAAADKLRCVQRELALRKRVYPNRVLTHRMTQRMADRELALMAAIVHDYEHAAAHEQLPLNFGGTEKCPLVPSHCTPAD